MLLEANGGRQSLTLFTSYPRKTMARLLRNIVYCKNLFYPRSLKTQINVLGTSSQWRKYSSGKFSTSIPEFENHPEIKDYADLYQYSINNSEEFWATLARSRISWYEDFTTISDCDLNSGKIGWFLEGKLNVTGKQKEVNVL